jgi:hypothetical protein
VTRTVCAARPTNPDARNRLLFVTGRRPKGKDP